MANYHTKVILKTDIVDSTPRMAEQTQSEMGLQRKQHKHFINDIAMKFSGSVFQDEGDAYWIEFPSVTDAALAGIEMQQQLRLSQAGKSEKQRLAIRIVITLGDILYQESDTIGMSMSLTARIEKITPSDQIYLSHAAWLILNKAEVKTSFVDEFNFKGLSDSEKVYKIEQRYGIRVINDQYIVLADAQGFLKFYENTTTAEVESFLIDYDELMIDSCAKHEGIIRQINGDMYFITFGNADQTISAIKSIWLGWKRLLARYHIGISIGAHFGTIASYRSYVFGRDINIAENLTDLSRDIRSNEDKIGAVISKTVKEDINFKDPDIMFIELDEEKMTKDIHKKTIQEHGAYRMAVK